MNIQIFHINEIVLMCKYLFEFNIHSNEFPSSKREITNFMEEKDVIRMFMPISVIFLYSVDVYV